jgi:hypothetical protein
MSPDALLTQEELEFLRAMQTSPQLNVRDTVLNLSVKGGPQVRELLMRLVSHEQVTIEAHLENQQISFPLQVVEDEFQAAHLEIGAPSIYEDGPMLRPWRLSLAQPVVLRDGEGRESDFWVRDISFKGALLEARNGATAPTQFQLWFTPQGHAPIARPSRVCSPTGLARTMPRLSNRCVSSSCSSTACSTRSCTPDPIGSAVQTPRQVLLQTPLHQPSITTQANNLRGL